MSDQTALVLVVDDDPSILPLLEAVFEGEAVTLVGAASGVGALERLAAGLAPDLLVVDLMMPEMGGLELLGELKKRPDFGRVPVILFTAKKLTEDVVAGLEAGATDYVAKPFDLGELRARLRGALRMRGLIQELERLREAALEEERLKVAVEAAGGIAHALTQPLTAALLRLESLLGRPGADDRLRGELEFVRRSLDRVAREVQRIQQVASYRTTPYPGGIEILDLEGE